MSIPVPLVGVDAAGLAQRSRCPAPGRRSRGSTMVTFGQ